MSKKHKHDQNNDNQKSIPFKMGSSPPTGQFVTPTTTALENTFGLGSIKGAIMADEKQSFRPMTAKCADGHKPLVVTKSGGVIIGGSCTNPFVTDADIYIGFDLGMKMTARRFPWVPGEEVLYPIQDMHPPKEEHDFKKLIEWTLIAVDTGYKVHAGCIGGHGRTGTFFAALVKEGLGIEDAITHVRKHYCEKAVESDAQVIWLNKVFGITKIAGFKSHFANDYPPKPPGNSHYGAGKTKAPPLKMFEKTYPVNKMTCKHSKGSTDSIWG